MTTITTRLDSSPSHARLCLVSTSDDTILSHAERNVLSFPLGETPLSASLERHFFYFLSPLFSSPLWEAFLPASQEMLLLSVSLFISPRGGISSRIPCIFFMSLFASPRGGISSRIPRCIFTPPLGKAGLYWRRVYLRLLGRANSFRARFLAGILQGKSANENMGGLGGKFSTLLLRLKRQATPAPEPKLVPSAKMHRAGAALLSFRRCALLTFENSNFSREMCPFRPLNFALLHPLSLLRWN
jgi:hypothetical protein